MVSEKIPENSNERKDIVERIYNEYGQWIRQTIDVLVYNGDDAEDIFQNFFVMLLTNPQLPHMIQHRGFLFCTLKNDIIDFMRHKNTYRDRIDRLTKKKTMRRKITQGKSLLDHLLAQDECSIIIQLIDQELFLLNTAGLS